MNVPAIALAAILSLPAAVQEATPAPKVDVAARLSPAFGALPDLAWKTYMLDLQNTGTRDLDLVCTVSDVGPGARAERREKLSAGSRKRVFFYLLNQYSTGRIHHLVREAGGRVHIDETLDETWHRPSGRGSGGTGTGLVGLALMDRLPVHRPTTSEVILCPEASFPDRWIGLDGFDFAMMRDYRLDALLPAQRDALREWIRRGGTLYLSAGSNRDWLITRPVQDLAPIELGPSSELTRFESIEKAFGDFRERTPFAYHRIVNGDALGDAKPPSAIRFRQGAGSVIVLPVDLERAPFDSWPGGTAFRDHLQALAIRQAASPGPRLSSGTAEFEHAATEVVATMPSFLVMLLISVVFIIVVGPVNYVILRRLNRTLLVVGTIPAISLFFMLVVVGTGQVLRGGSTVTFDVCLLETSAGDDSAVESRLLSLQSPSHRSYDVAWPGTAVATAGSQVPGRRTHWGRYYSGEDDPLRPLIDQTDRWTLRGCVFNQWQTQSFLGQTTRSLGGAVTYSFDGSELRIRNGTSMRILRGVLLDGSPALLTQGLVQTFDGVGAGETRNFSALARTRLARPDEEPGPLDERLLRTWVPGVLGSSLGHPFLLCVVEPPADEVSVNAARSAKSERACLLQVFPERP